MSRRTVAGTLGCALALLIAAQACDSPTGLDVSLLTVLVGDSQVGTVTLPLPAPVVLKVADENGKPLQGIVVEFTMRPDGNASPPADTSDQDGIVSVIATLGRSAGPVTIIAKIADAPETLVRLSATAQPGPPDQLIKQAGDVQGGTPGTTLSEPFEVRVQDQFGNNVPDVWLTWVLARGGGTLTAATVTDSTGTSRDTLTLGTVFGEHLVVVRVPGLDSVVFFALAGAKVEDPTNDTFDVAMGFTTPDVTALVAGSDDRNLIILIELVQEVVYGGNGEPNELGGLVDIDVDQDSTTGRLPWTDLFGDGTGSTGMGTDYYVTTFSGNEDGTYSVWDGIDRFVGTIMPEFGNGTVVLRIPLSLLGGDEGNVNVAAVVGSPAVPTDVVPNSGHLDFTNPAASGVMRTTANTVAPDSTLRWRPRWSPKQRN